MNTDPPTEVVGLFGLTRSEWLETALVAAIAAGAIVIAVAITLAASRVIHSFTRAAESQLDDELGHAIRRPFIAFVAIAAIGGGAATLSYVEEDGGWVGRVTTVLLVVVTAIAVRRVLFVMLRWQAVRPGPVGSRLHLHPGTLPLIERGLTLLVFAASVMIVLDALGLTISPLLAGLGIGGLAVALALQPLLGNVFASSYMLSDSSIRVGDWIDVDGGPVGLVDDIGWRATRIRSFDNNIVIVPNATLANSIVTNFSLTSPEADLSVHVGVAYEEDLSRVEAICEDVIRTLRDERETAVPDAEPLVRFQTFGDSRVDILLKMRAHTWSDTFLLRHELMKRIHARFVAEGITINYPARRLILEPADARGLELLRRPGDSVPSAQGH